MPKKLTNQDVISYINSKFPELDTSKVDYKNAKTPITLICPEHGEFKKAFSNIKSRDQGCPLCGYAEGARLKTKHGHKSSTYTSPTYASWHDMKQRCNNPKNYKFKDYGGRGITYCKEWEQFVNFLNDMGEKPDDKTLDRIDVDGNYSKSNCRWATHEEQAQNTRISIGVDKAKEIKRLKKEGVRPAHIAKQLDLKPSTVDNIYYGRSYKNINT